MHSNSHGHPMDAPLGANALGVGSYHADGDVSLAPLEGNYTATALFTDGSAGDTTTGVTAEGTPQATQTEVRVLAAPISIATWDQTKSYKGSVSLAFTYWDGLAWQTMNDTNGFGFPNSFGYASANRVATFTGVPSASIFRCVSTESDTSEGNIRTTDSRPA